jgi:hypothetical protein
MPKLLNLTSDPPAREISCLTSRILNPFGISRVEFLVGHLADCFVHEESLKTLDTFKLLINAVTGKVVY